MSGPIARYIQRFFREIADEGKRQAGHGASETSAALWNGNGYVMYGQTQHTKTNEQQQKASHPNEQQGKETDAKEMDGRDMGGHEI